MSSATDDAPAEVHPIIAAAQRGDVAEVSSALAADAAAAIAAVDKHERPALALAAARGHTEVVKKLLDAGAPDVVVAGWTAAGRATFGGHADVLAAIMAKVGAAAAAATPAGSSMMSPLLLATLKGHVECATLLLEAVPSALDATDASGRTPLILAASGGSVPMIDLLVSRGASLNATSNDGRTALMWAVSAVKPMAVGALARHGADPDVVAPKGPNEVVVPGKHDSAGESAWEISNSKHSKDPTLRHIAKYLRSWQEAREQGEGAPPMPPLPWVSHAEEQKARKAAEAEAAAEAAAKDGAAATEGGGDAAKATSPAIVDVTEADPDDIFGAEDVTVPAEPSGGAAPPPKAAAAADDLDDLD